MGDETGNLALFNNRSYMLDAGPSLKRSFGRDEETIRTNIKHYYELYAGAPQPMNAEDVRRWTPLAASILRFCLFRNDHSELQMMFAIGTLRLLTGGARDVSHHALMLSEDTTYMRQPSSDMADDYAALREKALKGKYPVEYLVTRWLLDNPMDFINTVSMTVLNVEVYRKPENLPN